MKRVLVTGAGGQLGRSLQDACSDHPNLIFRFAGKGDLDITAPEQIQAVFDAFQPDYCINCAAYTAVDQAEKEPERAMEVNATALEYLSGACLEHQTVLIHISTDYVFDGTEESGYLPDDPPNPINVYGRSKWKGECIIQKKMKRYFIIRTSWLYSRQYGPNFYLSILKKAKKGKKLMVTDAQRGCPTDTANLASHILNKIASGDTNYGISHYTDGEAMTWYDFARRILKAEGLENRTELRKVGNYRTFAQRPENSVLLRG